MTTYNTGNPVPSADARDRYDNSQTFDEVINGGLTYYTNRVGANVLTLKGMASLFSASEDGRTASFGASQAMRAIEFNQFLEKSGYETPIDYAPGISITRSTQIVRYLGELYRPKDSALPFVTTTFTADSAKWIANGDNSLRQDLASASDVAKGSALVGFFDPVSPAFLKTVSDIINMEPVSVLRLVPRGAETTALHNGTSTFPLAAPINALIQDMNAAGGGHIKLTYAKHMLESYIQYLSNIKMTGLGDASIFKGMFASPVNRMLTSPALVGQSNIILKDFKVDRTGVNTEHGVILGGIDGLTIDNVTVWGFRPEVTSGAMGISPFNEFATIQSKNVDVMNCKIVQPNNFGIAYGNVSGGTLTKNLFTDAWREAIGLETWGETSVVEDIVASHNILRMSTRPGNHVKGSVGPAVLVGGAGASYAGLTRRCTLSHNIISIDNAGGLSDYRGIVAVGGLTEATAVEDITLDTNTIHGAVGSGIAYGAAGSVTRRIHSRNNDIHNPNTGLNTGARGSALNVRYATDCTSKGDTVTGSTHTYAVYEDVGSLRNKFTEVDCGSPTVGVFHRNSDTSIFTKVGADQSTGGARFQEFVTIAAGQTVALSNRANPNRGSYRFEFSSGSYAHIHVVGAIAPVVISKSGDVYVAAADSEANTQAFTIFPISNAALAVTNRTALDRTFVVESLCAV